MKRTLSFISLGALALALTASLALSQGSAPAAGTPAPNATAKPAAPAKVAPAAKAETPAKATMKSAKTKMEMIDINSASKDDLMKLTGVGDVIADKIIAGRPYKTKAELVSKGVVNKGVYTKIRGHVIAKKAA